MSGGFWGEKRKEREKKIRVISKMEKRVGRREREKREDEGGEWNGRCGKNKVRLSVEEKRVKKKRGEVVVQRSPFGLSSIASRG